MRNIVLFALVSLAVLPGLACAQISSGADLEMALVDQNPFPAEPGTNVDIELSLENNGLGAATNLVVEIIPSGPFSIVKGDRVKTYQSIPGMSSVKLTYTLLVDDSALAGDYDLEFRLYNQITPDSYQTKEIEITLIGETKIIIDMVETTPATLEPGGSAIINVMLKNVGTGDARQLEVRMESNASELVPVLSGGLVYIGDLDAGENATAGLHFNIDTDADQDTYLTTLTLTYKDENNQESTESFTLGIPVEGNIRFEIITIEPNFNRGTLDIEVANKGTGDAHSVETRLVVNGEALGVDYLSQLKASKKTTFNFPLALSGDAELVISYVEPGLKENTIIKDMGPLNFAAPGGGSSYTLLFLIALAVTGYFVWRRWFRKKKKR